MPSTRAVSRAAIAAAAAGGLLALPSVAAAADYCVNRTGCPPANTFPDVQPGLDAAAANPNSGGPDRVLIGPGNYVSGGTPFTYSGDPVDIAGAGNGREGTHLSATEDDFVTVLSLTGAGPHRVTDLALYVPTGLFNSGLMIAGTAERLDVTASPSTTAATGIWTQGTSTIADTSVKVPATASGFINPDQGIASNGDSLVVRDTKVEGERGIVAYSALTKVQRTRATGVVGVTFGAGHGSIESSLVEVPSGGTGVLGRASTSDVSFQVSNTTIVGGAGTTTGVAAIAGGDPNRTATGTVGSTLLHNLARPLRVRTDNASATATITADYSALEPAGNVVEGSGTGGIGLGANNLTNGADPRFESVGGPGAYRLRADSPLIDRGDPDPLGTQSPFDLDRGVRVRDGDNANGARRDIGAFEFQPAPPVDPQPQPGPVQPQPPAPDPQPPADEFGFKVVSVKPRAKDLALVVSVQNTGARRREVSVGATERAPDKKRKVRRFPAIRRYVTAGQTTKIVLRVPGKLAPALKRRIAAKGRVVRKPRITVKDLASGRRQSLTPRVVSRARKGDRR